MKVYVESADQIVETTADSRGRINLGMDYAGEDVQLAILEPTDD